MTLTTFRELEALLQGSSVVRVHRSFMVNLRWITSFNGHEVQLHNRSFPVSETYAAALKHWATI